jgi:hypothetical protein
MKKNLPEVTNFPRPTFYRKLWKEIRKANSQREIIQRGGRRKCKMTTIIVLTLILNQILDVLKENLGKLEEDWWNWRFCLKIYGTVKTVV